MATSLVGLEERANASVKVEMVRVIRASRQRVFDAWTRPEMIRQWFTPGTMTVADAAMDARESGEWRLLMNGGCVEDEQTDAARRTLVSGRYTRVDPYDVLAFTWRNPRILEEESLVTIELRDLEGGTELKLTHERFLTEASRDQHAAGWESVLGKLQEFFAAA